MKTTKAILVTMIMVLSTIGFAQVDQNETKEPPPNQISILISLEKAVQNPYLKMAIYEQVTPRIFKKNFRGYTAKVVYRNITFNIYGTRAEWKVFFSVRPVASHLEG